MVSAVSAGLSLGLVLLQWALACAGKQCTERNVTGGSVLLQQGKSAARSHLQQEEQEPEAEGEQEPEAEERDLSAEFLIQATFGPTRASMDSLRGKTYTDWLVEQVSLPVESHREHYRKQVNPHFYEGSEDVGHARSPCTVGSRWHSFVFTARDVSKSIHLQASDKIFVNGDFRTDLWREALPSSWVGLSNFTGHICYVVEKIGGDVHVGTNARCSDRIVMPNLAIWLANGSISTSMTLSRVKPNVHVVQDSSEPCDFGSMTGQDGEEPVFMNYEGDFLRYDPRLELIENTVESPTRDPRACVPRNAINERGCKVRKHEGCVVSCGSPGEAGNDAVQGHQLLMRTSRAGANVDNNLDNRYSRSMRTEMTKSVVWIAKALGAEDQLRQRMAWAMSQIFVVSSQGLSLGDLSETWLTYYDIFVRNAFGNFGDVLREVTFSPLMGRYLTHTGSSAYAYDGRYPNENYAREVMQLFSIGLEKLSPDGTPVRDESGEVLPSYGNEQILNFARVFTGLEEQPARSNLEYTGPNLVDPLRMNVAKHDVFPKLNLDGGYIGDGLPLCAVELSAQSFLAKGAKFEFSGFGERPGALELSPDSALFGMLCASADQATCSFSFLVELQEMLACTEAECMAKADTLRFVKVQEAYYRFMSPVCVHLFLHDSIMQASSTEAQVLVAQPGYCLNADGDDVKTGVIRLDRRDGSNQARQDECVEACRRAGGTACELVWGRGNKGCFVHMQPVASGNGRDQYLCWVFNTTSDAMSGYSYELLERNSALCPAGTEVTSVSECRAAIRSMGFPADDAWTGNKQGLPPGCSWSGSRAFWNMGEGKVRAGYGPVCRAHVTLDADGQVMLRDGGSKLAVQWSGGSPASGIHLVSVKVLQVFDSVPTKYELESRLFIGSDTPTQDCFVCDGEVKAFGQQGIIDASTVFELNGKFFKNSESIVRIANGSQTFRNPPVFLRSTAENGAERAALAEIGYLISHIFQHDNTPAFISRRLIQRFTSSNPSQHYIRDVAEAFRTGRYGETAFSAMYGDLAATMAAILLHPEARSPDSGSATTVHGALREPILKFMHFMRSMEYKDPDGAPIVLKSLEEEVGQFPYESPTVFNYYLPDYELPTLEPEPETEPEGELEMEGEVESEAEEVQLRVAPELQILTPAYFVGYLNGMSSLIWGGVSYDCVGAQGDGVGIHSPLSTKGRWRQVCPQATSTWQTAQNMEETVAELDVLLTGGRLTPVARRLVRTAYEEAAGAERVQAAQQAIVMMPEFNTLGNPLPKESARPARPKEMPSAQRSYKAFVMLFLAGGADTFNLLVPQCQDMYQEYRSVRTDLALDSSELVKVSTTGQSCDRFGIHSGLSFLKVLYNKGQAAFIANVGNLVEPTSMEGFKNSHVQRCSGLFSHANQQLGAQTLKCQDSGAGPMGAGGRIADALGAGSHKFATTSFSLAGNAAWSKGVTTEREIVDEIGAGFRDYEQWRKSISNITAQQHGNVYSEVYIRAFQTSIEATQNFQLLLDGATLMTNYRTATYLERQLHQVAKLIKTQEVRQAERDFFFISFSGWDMHSNMKSGLRRKFQEIDAALRGFVAEMEAQGNWDKVVLATSSEFGRTLDSNGGGSDHAWAGNHFVISGGLKGGQVFNRFPASLALGNDHDLGRGRLIPEYPWESLMVPIASWMGIEADWTAIAFPNLHNFNSTHIIAENKLFKS